MNYVRNKTTLGHLPVLSEVGQDVVQGALYEYNGSLGIDYYIGAAVENDKIILVGFGNGMRWNDKSVVPSNFTRLPIGAAITVEQGEES